MDLSYILNHLGEERDQYFDAVSPPIIQTSNFYFKDVDSLRNAFPNERNVHVYTRGNNPTVEILRKKIAALAGAEDALVFSSGVAAISAAVIGNVQAGDHVVCVHKPYGWTDKLLNKFLSRYGVTSTMIDGTKIENFIAAIQPNTKVIFLESPNSFTFDLQDIKAVVKLAKEKGIVTIIDNSTRTWAISKIIRGSVAYVHPSCGWNARVILPLEARCIGYPTRSRYRDTGITAYANTCVWYAI